MVYQFGIYTLDQGITIHEASNSTIAFGELGSIFSLNQVELHERVNDLSPAVDWKKKSLTVDGAGSISVLSQHPEGEICTALMLDRGVRIEWTESGFKTDRPVKGLAFTYSFDLKKQIVSVYDSDKLSCNWLGSEYGADIKSNRIARAGLHGYNFFDYWVDLEAIGKISKITLRRDDNLSTRLYKCGLTGECDFMLLNESRLDWRSSMLIYKPASMDIKISSKGFIVSSSAKTKTILLMSELRGEARR